MLIASVTKYCTQTRTCENDANVDRRIFYWFGTHYDSSLLIQACIMTVVQSLLLHVLLINRAGSDGAFELSHPFGNGEPRRPYNFWQWRSRRPYWMSLIYFAGALSVLQFFVGGFPLYVNILGYGGLTVEAILPIPQILKNHQNKSCKGFRLSVLGNWLLGDVFKMTFFFLSPTYIPWAFKLCGLFQWACDIYLGVQYAQFGEGNASS